MKRPKKIFLRSNGFNNYWINYFSSHLLVFVIWRLIETRTLTRYCAGIFVFGLILCVTNASYGLETHEMKAPQNGLAKTDKAKPVNDLFSPLQHVLLGSVRFFQEWVSPIDGSRCNFSPTCSRYGYEAVRNHGSFLGIMITADRLMRCSYLTENSPPYNRLPNGKMHDPVANNLLPLP